MEPEDLQERILESLNKKQHQAVTAPSSGVLQIIAGPGTGKTKVIVSRVAYLMLHENILPQNIIVTTFTKKAANEMMERLRELFKGTDIAVGKLLIGTFHSICYKIIVKYGRLIGLEGMSIADEKDANQILTNALNSRITAEQWLLVKALSTQESLQLRSKLDFSSKFCGCDPKKLRRHISKIKSAGMFPEDYEAQTTKNKFLAVVYRAYQDELLANKVLDFDDCLLYCYRIVSSFPVLNFVKHTLVDEFQDTNEVQLQLMYQFAKRQSSDVSVQSNVTIVGDPDQSIYAFRDAQSVNFDKMRDHYAKVDEIDCQIITLDENYRSTSDILNISETVMRQQSGRVVKNLTSQLEKSVKPFLAVLKSNEEEGRWIAHQAEFLAGLPQNIFSYSDMAILVRSAFQTRAIENELTKKKIPYFMVRGKAFWDRKEVVAILDYLRCVANEDDKLAFMRSVNFPKRGLGPKSLTDLESLIDSERVKNPQQTVLCTLQKIASGSLKTSLGPKMRKNLQLFLDVIESTTSILLEKFVLDSGDHSSVLDQAFSNLYKTSKILGEFEENTVDCDLNIVEVKSQLLSFEPPSEEMLPDLPDQEPVAEEVITGPLFIRKFLELISLYDTDPGQTEEQAEKPKISISTIHGSKGLEWPVVFVPGVNEGLLPASFAINEYIPETINEERRCFYVATSRAKSLLYISAYTEKDSGGWRKVIDTPSRFMDQARDQCVSRLEFTTPQKLQVLYEIRGQKFIESDFDYPAYYKEYTRGLQEYVKKKKPKKKDQEGFTSAKLLDISPPPESKFKKKSFAFKPAMQSTGLNVTQLSEIVETAKEIKRAPPYIPVRNSQSISVNEGGSSGVKRAPAYVPVRTRGKKRLGTKAAKDVEVVVLDE